MIKVFWSLASVIALAAFVIWLIAQLRPSLALVSHLLGG